MNDKAVRLGFAILFRDFFSGKQGSLGWVTDVSLGGVMRAVGESERR